MQLLYTKRILIRDVKNPIVDKRSSSSFKKPVLLKGTMFWEEEYDDHSGHCISLHPSSYHSSQDVLSLLIKSDPLYNLLLEASIPLPNTIEDWAFFTYKRARGTHVAEVLGKVLQAALQEPACVIRLMGINDELDECIKHHLSQQ